MPEERDRLAHVERLLAEKGHDVGRARVAVGAGGIAVGFPGDPMLHVSWWAVAAGVIAGTVVRRMRRR